MQPVSALELRKDLLSGKTSKRDIALHSLDRIDQIDKEIGAFVSVAKEGDAIALADKADGPLAGLPIAVKDIFDTADLPTEYGSCIYSNWRPAADAAIVSLIRRAGGYVLGKAVTCEFAYMSPTATKNPRDINRTAGGSSAGSAAAVAAGMVPFAIGTQTGGSTIRPASFCGVASYKPTFDMFPTTGMKCFSWSLDTVGLFAATVPDLSWFAEALIRRPLGMAEQGGRRYTIGVPCDNPWQAYSPAAKSAIETACAAIEAAGGIVKTIEFPDWSSDLIDLHAEVQGYEATQALAFEFDRYKDNLSPMLSGYLTTAGAIDPARYDLARKKVLEAKERTMELFAMVDVLLMPSALDEAPVGFLSTGDPVYNKAWTLLGTPAVNVPGLTGPSGMPIGLQVVAAPWDDGICLGAACFVERAINMNRTASVRLPAT
jgi:Asp-tRNA(Asn)/Glu-tRNA(Gln) amidotransferase A subunit family amidase